jgi:hypothetical protein
MYYDQNHVPEVDEEGVVGVKKKKYCFHKTMLKTFNQDSFSLKIERFLSNESI